MLDLESEVMRGQGSIPTGGNIFHWSFLFSQSKASAANIGIIAILVHFGKTLVYLLVVKNHKTTAEPLLYGHSIRRSFAF